MKVETAPITLKIFLVDDSSLICERLTALLVSIPGVQVVGTAATPDEALLKLAPSEARVAIIDLQLKDGNGLMVLKGLSAMGSPIVPIMFINHSTESIRRQCLQSGAQFFFDKSKDIARICSMIRRMAANQSQD